LLLSKGSNSEQLLKDVNARIKELIKDGSITEISQKYLRGDFAPEVQ
jgi:polar amino acid transport system substrate-binding protein